MHKTVQKLSQPLEWLLSLPPLTHAEWASGGEVDDLQPSRPTCQALAFIRFSRPVLCIFFFRIISVFLSSRGQESDNNGRLVVELGGDDGRLAFELVRRHQKEKLTIELHSSDDTRKKSDRVAKTQKAQTALKCDGLIRDRTGDL